MCRKARSNGRTRKKSAKPASAERHPRSQHHATQNHPGHRPGRAGRHRPGLGQQNTAPKIAVTDLAYAQRVSEYFMVGNYQRSSQMSAQGSGSHSMFGGSGQHSMQASEQASGSYVAGRYSYIEQRELGGYTNTIKGAILQGTYFRLVQGKGFDAGQPRPSKAEQVLNQVQGGKMATPQAQPQVTDVIARIKKGEFHDADYVLFGVVSSIDFTDALSPLQGTT